MITDSSTIVQSVPGDEHTEIPKRDRRRRVLPRVEPMTPQERADLTAANGNERLAEEARWIGKQVPLEQQRRLATWWVLANQNHKHNPGPDGTATQCRNCWGWANDYRHF